ncbi:MAG: fibronectin type III domain-containing protein [Methanomassiliicoccales archaeon]|jgi:hypothetical protein
MKPYRVLFLILIFQLSLFFVIPTSLAAVAQVVPSEPFEVNASNWNGIAHISWREPNQTGPGITFYHIFRQLNGTGSVKIGQLNATEREYNDRMPQSAVNVTYWIVAENLVGTGNASDNVTLLPGAHPTVPTGLHAVAGIDYVDISWTSPVSDGGSNITKYVVRRQVTSTGESIQFDVTVSGNSVPVTSAHDDQATSGDIYVYNVKAVSSTGESGFSDSVTVTSPPKNINDNSGLLSVFAMVLAVVAFQLAIVALYVVIKRKAFKPKAP